MFSVRKRAFFAVLALTAAGLAAGLALTRPAAAPAAVGSQRFRAAAVVLDAGHGGEDGGAVGLSGTPEKDVNLAVTLRARDLCRLMGVPVTLTRDADRSLGQGRTLREIKTSDLEARARLCRETEGAVLISVHQNYYPDRASRGPQVFYRADSAAGALLAARLQGRIERFCGTGGRHPMPLPNENYLLANAGRPAVVAECGFLSNPEEERLLLSPDYQDKLAFAVAAEALECVTVGLETGR